MRGWTPVCTRRSISATATAATLRTASARRAMTSGRRPSLKLGTHSMRAQAMTGGGAGSALLGLDDAREVDHGHEVVHAHRPAVDHGEKLDEVGVLPKGGVVPLDLPGRHLAQGLRLHPVDDRREDALTGAEALPHGHPHELALDVLVPLVPESD